MKRLLIIAGLLTTLVTAQAVPRHYFYFLVGQPTVNIEFNYDQVRFDTPMNATELSNFRQAHQATWETIFIRELNEELEDARITARKNARADYTIRIVPTKATKYGFLRATVTFLDKQNTPVKTLEIRGEREHHYGLTESYMDSMKELGENLGDIIDEGM